MYDEQKSKRTHNIIYCQLLSHIHFIEKETPTNTDTIRSASNIFVHVLFSKQEAVVIVNSRFLTSKKGFALVQT